MPLSWNEIRHRAIQFTNQWTGVKSEVAEKQTFWNEFFDVFCVPRRAVASFEEPVKKLTGHYGAIDLFWKRKALVEHKSGGEDLSRAKSQAFDYLQALIKDSCVSQLFRISLSYVAGSPDLAKYPNIGHGTLLYPIAAA